MTAPDSRPQSCRRKSISYVHRGVGFRCRQSVHPQPPGARRRLWVFLSAQRHNGELQPLSRTADMSHGHPSRAWTGTVQQGRCSRRKTWLYGIAHRLLLLGHRNGNGYSSLCIGRTERRLMTTCPKLCPKRWMQQLCVGFGNRPLNTISQVQPCLRHG
jgi:hypothetical protein